MKSLKLSDYNYDLPEELIADQPPKVRGQSNILILDRQAQTIVKKKYFEVADDFEVGDILVINETKVIKARLEAVKQNGTKRELVVVERHGRNDDWQLHKVVYRGRLSAGDILMVDDNKLEVVEILGDGVALIKSEIDLLDLCQESGTPPLPPYMKRKATKEDIERYQTVWANRDGSVAAPTASLNMTEKTLEKLETKGVKIVRLTLHVGLGTFLPIRTDDLSQHKMHQEYFEVGSDSLTELLLAIQNNQRIVALGTTVTRTLEYLADFLLELADKVDFNQSLDNKIKQQDKLVAKTYCDFAFGSSDSDDPSCCQVLPDSEKEANKQKLLSKIDLSVLDKFNLIQLPDGGVAGEADIFIYPGYQFKIVKALLTNFHAPKSTVLMMASAFAGWDFLMQSYDLAKQEEMNFLSYGDSMLIK